MVPNGYTTKCSKPYWSNPPFLFFWRSGTRALIEIVLSARVPERQKNKNGGLDQYGFEHFVVLPFDTTGLERVKLRQSLDVCN